MNLDYFEWNRKYILKVLGPLAMLLLLTLHLLTSNPSPHLIYLSVTQFRARTGFLSQHSNKTYGSDSNIGDTVYKREEPKLVGGVLRWKIQLPRRGSLLEAINKGILSYDDHAAKNKYVRRWEEIKISPQKTSGPKTILYYNDFVRQNDFFFGEGTEPFIIAGCPITNCLATSNRTLVRPKDADAIVWHQRSDNNALPRRLSKHTRLVYFMMESQNYVFLNLRPMENIFNYTMTFSEHSDVFNPYGIFVKRKEPLPNLENKNYAAGKSKMAVWFVSHCSTKSFRESLVEKLKELIVVDVYGSCGKFKCIKDNNQNSDTCLRAAEKKYKFYFSFENSLCKNYITEKFYTAAKYDMIPVVYGLGPYDTVAPPHSYINAFDFNNVKELADYLIYLDKNDTAYNEYFWWKSEYQSLSHYKAHKPVDYNRVSWCQLCEKLNTDTVPQSYTKIEPFHSPNHHCIGGKSDILRTFMLYKGKS